MEHRIPPEDTGKLQLAPFRSRIRIAIFHHVLINLLIYFVSRVSYEDKHPAYIPYFRKVWFPCWSILMIFDLGDKLAGDERIQGGRLYVTFSYEHIFQIQGLPCFRANSSLKSFVP